MQAKRSDIKKYAERYAVGWDVIRAQRLSRMKEMRIVPEATRLTPRSRCWDYGEVNTGENPAWHEIPADRRVGSCARMAIYAAMVDCMDRNIGFVIDDLRDAGELENTLVIFISDNGACAEWDPWGFDIESSPSDKLHRGADIEAMGSNGTFHRAGSGWANACNTPWRLYKHFAHEGGINSPCIMHWPARIEQPGSIAHTPCHVIDLMPTIAKITSTDYQGTIDLPGRSLVDLFEGKQVKTRHLFFEHGGTTRY